MDTTISSLPREIPLGDTQRSKHWPNRILSMSICDVQNLTKYRSDHFVFRPGRYNLANGRRCYTAETINEYHLGYASSCRLEPGTPGAVDVRANKSRLGHWVRGVKQGFASFYAPTDRHSPLRILSQFFRAQISFRSTYTMQRPARFGVEHATQVSRHAYLRLCCRLGGRDFLKRQAGAKQMADWAAQSRHGTRRNSRI